MAASAARGEVQWWNSPYGGGFFLVRGLKATGVKGMGKKGGFNKNNSGI